MKFENNYVVIMAGGIGSRFWPESRQTKPKQFLDLLGTGKSLLQWTYERFSKVCPVENIYFITNENYVTAISEQIPRIDPGNIISEPERKNTAICAAYVAYKLYAQNPDATIVLSPSDHLILDDRAFENTLYEALSIAEDGDRLLTLGMTPTRPDTGYGYILYDKEADIKAYPVIRFTEKPVLEDAIAYLESGKYLWNSGLFIWSAKSMIAAFHKYLPEVDKLFSEQLAVYGTNAEPGGIREIYAACPDISIDYGIMEKADNVFVLPASFGWSDLGTWESAFDNSSKDHLGNAVHGANVVVIDAKNCIVKAPEGKIVVVQGVEGLIIVDTSDALLICERTKEQYIKQYVNEVKKIGGEAYL